MKTNIIPLKVFKIGVMAFVILIFLHLLFQFGPKPDDPALHQLLNDMENFKIKIMGVHSLLKFHNGFSVNMGFLLSAFGIQYFLLANPIVKYKKAFISTIIITAIIFAIVLIYFHELAFGFVSFTLLCFSESFYRKKVSNS